MDVSLINTCQSPVRFFNHHLNRWMVVPCGHCKACQLKKSNRLKTLLNIESSLPNTYTLFLTLTYESKNLPTIYLPKDYDRKDIFQTTTSPNNGKTLYFDEARNLSNPQKLYKPNALCHTFCKRHCQLWLKKLRKHLFKTYKAYHLFRYFLVAEYGTKNHLPHYHVLLFFKNEEIRNYVLARYDTSMYSDKQGLQKLAKSRSSDWSFGIVDAQIPKSQHGCATYVSGYLTYISDAQNILSLSALKPWYICSRKPFIGFDPSNYKRFIQDANKGIVFATKFNTQKSSFDHFLYPRNYANKRYPKCSGFSRSSRSALSEIYGTLLRLLTDVGLVKYDYVYNKGMRYSYDIQQVNDFVKCYFDSVSITKKSILKDKTNIYFDINGRLSGYHDVYCLKHCLYTCLEYHITPDDYVSQLLTYYTKRSSYLMQSYIDAYNSANLDVSWDLAKYDIDLNQRYISDNKFDNYNSPIFSQKLKTIYDESVHEIDVDYFNRSCKHSRLERNLDELC